MIYTTVTVSGNLSTFQKDFLIKSGFAMSGIAFSRSVKSNELYIIIGQLASKNIPFGLQSQTPQYNSKPCVGCKR
jgi:hypothetical protein